MTESSALLHSKLFQWQCGASPAIPPWNALQCLALCFPSVLCTAWPTSMHSHGDASARDPLTLRDPWGSAALCHCQGPYQGIQLQEERIITRRRFALLSSYGSPSRRILRGCESEFRIQRSLSDITACSVSFQSFTDRTCSYLQALSCSSEKNRV